jgi:hypothetical protein
MKKYFENIKNCFKNNRVRWRQHASEMGSEMGSGRHNLPAFLIKYSFYPPFFRLNGALDTGHTTDNPCQQTFSGQQANSG